MNIEIEELETADYDILENVRVALYRLWKMKIIVVLITMIGVLLALVYIVIVGVETKCRSSATIFSAAYGSFQESSNGVAVMNTYSGLLNSTRVCERAVSRLSSSSNITAEYLQGMVNSGRIFLSGASTASKSYGYKLTLSVIGDSPELVIDIANAMAMAFSDEINDLLGSSTLQVLDEARRYAVYDTMNYKLIIILCGAIVFVLSAGIIFIKEFFATRVYSAAQCEMKKENVLGMVPYYK